jgi:hydroxymethylpyrimidine/phosphomethylpyrimidine kinase
VIGGLDPGGGSGLLRDVATATALGARPHAIGTAWTEQSPGVHGFEPRDPEALVGVLARAVAGLAPAAVKIGMAVGPETAIALLDGLAAFAGPVVVDPVLATSQGGPLWLGAPRDLLPLLRRATVATPNAVEASALAERPVSTLAEAEQAGQTLVQRDGIAAVLIKGGHLDPSGAGMTDLLVTRDGARPCRHPRLSGPTPRGTGCALATALAIALGRGQALADAIQTATSWLTAAISAAVPVGSERHLGTPPSRVLRKVARGIDRRSGL